MNTNRVWLTWNWGDMRLSYPSLLKLSYHFSYRCQIRFVFLDWNNRGIKRGIKMIKSRPFPYRLDSWIFIAKLFSFYLCGGVEHILFLFFCINDVVCYFGTYKATIVLSTLAIAIDIYVADRSGYCFRYKSFYFANSYFHVFFSCWR